MKDPSRVYVFSDEAAARFNVGRANQIAPGTECPAIATGSFEGSVDATDDKGNVTQRPAKMEHLTVFAPGAMVFVKAEAPAEVPAAAAPAGDASVVNLDK